MMQHDADQTEVKCFLCRAFPLHNTLEYGHAQNGHDLYVLTRADRLPHQLTFTSTAIARVHSDCLRILAPSCRRHLEAHIAGRPRGQR